MFVEVCVEFVLTQILIVGHVLFSMTRLFSKLIHTPDVLFMKSFLGEGPDISVHLCTHDFQSSRPRRISGGRPSTRFMVFGRRNFDYILSGSY